MLIEDVYRTGLTICPPDASLRDVARAIRDDDTGIVLVVADGRLLGVVSERDITVAIAEGSDPDRAVAADHATTEVLSVEPAAEVTVAARRMVDGRVRHLPVVELTGELVGMVAMRDLFSVDTLLGEQHASEKG